MEHDKISINQILNTCIIIIGFSLTIVSLFRSEKIEIPNIIFWLIVLPFSIEAIMVAIYNYLGKGKKIIDLFLIFCFGFLPISLIIIFWPNILPKLNFIFQNNFILGGLAILAILLYIGFAFFMVWLEIESSKYKLELKNKFFESFYKLRKKIEKNNNYFDHIVVILDNRVLYTIVTELIKEEISGYGIRFYNPRDFFENSIIDLIQEKIIIITDLQNNLMEIVKKFKKDNNILGILSTFNISNDQKEKLKSCKISIEECNVGIK